MSQTRSRSRSAARLAAVQALYQQEMEGTPLPRLLKEFHDHRLGATIEDARYHQAEQDFFDDIVTGADARRAEIDRLISARLAEGWSLERLDRPMRAILRGTEEAALTTFLSSHASIKEAIKRAGELDIGHKTPAAGDAWGSGVMRARPWAGGRGGLRTTRSGSGAWPCPARK